MKLFDSIYLKIKNKNDIVLEEEFQSDPIDETTYEGDTVELRCDPPRGEPLPIVYWLKNDALIDTSIDSSRYKVSNDNSLLILVVNKYDTGNYVCVAHNLMEKRYSKPAKLTVLGMLMNSYHRLKVKIIFLSRWRW